MRKLLAHCRRDTCGQDLIEYALLAGTLAAGVGLALSLLSTAIQDRYTSVAGQLGSGTPSASGAAPASPGDSGSGGAGAASAGSGGGDGQGGGAPGGNNGNHAGGGNNGNGRGNLP